MLPSHSLTMHWSLRLSHPKESLSCLLLPCIHVPTHSSQFFCENLEDKWLRFGARQTCSGNLPPLSQLHFCGQEFNLPIWLFSKMKVNNIYSRVVLGFVYFSYKAPNSLWLKWALSKWYSHCFPQPLLLSKCWSLGFLCFPGHPQLVISLHSESLLSRAIIAPYFLCSLPWWSLSSLETLFHKPLFSQKTQQGLFTGQNVIAFGQSYPQNWQSLGL